MPLTGKDSLNFIFMFTSAGFLVYGPMMSEKGGPEKMFSWHPLCMSLGYGLMIAMGFWMFNYEDLPGEWIDSRASRRKAHAFCQLCGFALIIVGYMAVARAHHDVEGAKLFQRTSNTPWAFQTGPGWVRLAHVIIGYCGLALIVLQVIVGALKYRGLTQEDDDQDEHYSIHELIGNLTYASGVLNILIGVWLWEAWSIPIRAAISLTLCTSIVFGPRWDGSRGFLSADEAPALPPPGKKGGNKAGG
mmetsp:Transcript_166078/g.318937  ORF Transcript_166078/g.318937 Transcript_166078/m.318937 type:complete len:246 (-) Transcript_166078:14-751(-)